MDRRSKMLWIAPTLLVALACSESGEQESMSMAAGYVDAINEVREAEAATLNTAMLENLANVYAADVLMMPPGEPAVTGREAATAWFSDFVEMFDVNLDYTSSDVTVAGDWAIERYTGTATMTPKEGGEAATETIKGIHIYQRQPDGSWLIVQDIWNYDEAMAGQG